MPWNFPGTEFLKKRACRYILQHYLGQFLKEKLTLDQLSVDLYNGTGTLKDMELDVESLNEALGSSNVPVEIVDGFVDQISVVVPWTQLIQDNTELEIHGLQLTLQPKQRKDQGAGLEAMFNSMSSMTTSLQIAEDCLKSANSEDQGNEIAQPYEGVQKFAQTIDSVLCRVKVTLVDTIIRLEHLPVTADTGVALEIRIKRVEYYDDMAKEEGSPVDNPEKLNVWEPAAIAHKNFMMEGVQLFSDEFSRNIRLGESSVDLESSLPQNFMSTASTLSPESLEITPTNSQDVLCEPVQIAVLTGKTSLILKIKQGDTVQGPKIETELDLGGLHILLSPKQFHGFMELVEGLMAPDTSDGTSKKGRGNKNKPMSPDDYKKVETELQRHLATGRVQHQQRQFLHTQYMGMQDIMTQSIGEVDEEQYFSMTPERMKEMQSSVGSNYSISSNRTTSTVNTSKQGQRKESKSSKDSLQRILDDPSAELCRYHFRLAFFSFCLLHENPCQRVQLSSPAKALNSKPKMKDIAAKFFQRVFSFSAAGKSELKELRCYFSEALEQDHLRFVGKPLNIDCTEKNVPTHQSVTFDLTLGLFEAVECLYNRVTENSTPEYTELLVFPRDVADKPSQMYSSMHVSSPAVKASIKTVQQIRGHQRISAYPRTEINVSLGKLESEIDVTLVDRVNSLIKPNTLHKRPSNGNTTHMVNPDTFSQTLEEGSLSQDKKYDFTVSSSQTKITFRIPIPDLRSTSEVGKLPWWQKNLRDEVLVLCLQEIRFQTAFMASQSMEQLDFSCKDAQASFRIDPNQSPVPFASVSCEGDGEDGFNLPQLVIKFTEKTISVLEEEQEEVDNGTPLDSLNGACEFTKQDPSPFSSRKSMYSKEEMSDKDHTATHISHEMILPGDRDEMSQFQEKATSNCQMTMDLILPRVNLFLPSKHFYEVLYNRLNNDLLLWEPMAPSPIQTSGSSSIQPFDLSCYTQVLQDTFSMARSAIQYDSSDDDEDLYGPHYSIHDSRHPRQKRSGAKLPSKMCLSLRIDSGQITAYTESKVESCHGEVIALVGDANLFVVTNYNGDPSLQYVCFRSSMAELYHSGAINDSYKVTSVDQVYMDSIPSHLQSCKTIYRSEPGVQCHQSTDIGFDIDSMDMVSVAIKIRLDSSPINDLTTDEKIKEFLVAVGISGATLSHKMADNGQSWISQLMGLLDVVDYDILGYVMPKVLTELHVHLWSCAVDYRPLYIPTRAVLAAESFSISSNIVANSPTSLLRFVLDDAALYLSQKNSQHEINLKEDYVGVIDLERFELELRSSEGKDQRFPKTDLRLLTNKINLRTCCDSCQALMELIQYFASDGDLTGSEVSKEEDIVTDIITNQESDEESEEEDKSSLSQSRMEQLHTLVEDAMQESNSNPDSPEIQDPSQAKPSTEVFFLAGNGLQSHEAPPAGVMRPIVISASADSVTSSSISEAPANFSDDEEFCIIDDPGLGIMPRTGEPEVRVFTDDPIEIKENHFSLPLGRTDLLKAPEHFPPAEYRYTLKELTIVWFMYGGSDFGSKGVHPQEKEKEVVMNFKGKEMSDCEYDVTWKYSASSAKITPAYDRMPWQIRGGPGRDVSTLMELQLTKVRMQYEIYPSHTVQSSRQVLIIHDIEVRDKLVNSNINKFLYQYSSEKFPKQTHANMVVIKAVHSRPDSTVKSEECALRVSLQPIRLNIDQDSLYFLRKFFTELTEGTTETPSEGSKDTEQDSKSRSRSVSGATATVAPPPIMKVGQPFSLEGCDNDTQEPLMMFDELQKSSTAGEVTSEESQSSRMKSSEHSESMPIFIKSFVFSPDVPIRLDYHGKKWVDREHGTLTGLLVGLAQLNCSELKLKRLTYRHGLLGLDKVQSYCINEWINDILKNQLPSILGGVGPMHSFVQLAQGVKDLFWLPVEQYKRDGRIVRGIQRGATSFSTSTAMAVLELSNRMIQSVQYLAEVSYDVVTPGPSIRLQRRRLRGQPTDIREGMENAYIAIREGFSSTAHNIVDVTKKEHEQKGITGAVGAAFRLVPPTVISPVIIAADATSNVLGGMRNQLQPDARKEDEDKWKVN